MDQSSSPPSPSSSSSPPSSSSSSSSSSGCPSPLSCFAACTPRVGPSLVSHRFSLFTWLTLFVVAVVVPAVSLSMRATVGLVNTAQIIVSALPLAACWAANRNRTSANHLVAHFNVGFIIGVIIGLVQIVLTLLTIYWSFSRTATLVPIIFVGLLAVLVITLSEEAAKYFVASRANRPELTPAQRDTIANTIFTVGWSIGFATGLALDWTFALAYYSPPEFVAIVGLLLSFFVVPMQALTTWFIELRVALRELVRSGRLRNYRGDDAGHDGDAELGQIQGRRLPIPTDETDPDADADADDTDVERAPNNRVVSSSLSLSNIPSSFFGIVWPTMLLRVLLIVLSVTFSLIIGTRLYAFTLFASVPFTVVAIVVIVVMVKRQEKKMPREYLQRVGQLSVLGYGELAPEPTEVPLA